MLTSEFSILWKNKFPRKTTKIVSISTFLCSSSVSWAIRFFLNELPYVQWIFTYSQQKHRHFATGKKQISDINKIIFTKRQLDWQKCHYLAFRVLVQNVNVLWKSSNLKYSLHNSNIYKALHYLLFSYFSVANDDRLFSLNPVYHVEKLPPFIIPLTIYGHVMGFFYRIFDVTSGHLREIRGNLQYDDHIR